MSHTLDNKLENMNKSTQNYYNNVITYECHGDKCRIHANDLTGLHCESCYGDLDEVNPKQLDEDFALEKKYDNIVTIECHGDKCRIHKRDGLGYHCESCYGEISLSDDEVRESR